MKTRIIAATLLVASSIVFAAEEAKKPAADAAKSCCKLSGGCGMKCKQACEGCIMLFDNATTFGWKTEGDVKVADKALVVGGGSPASAQTTTEFGDFQLCVQYVAEDVKGVQLVLNGKEYALEAGPKADAAVQGCWKVESQDKSHTVTAAFGPAGSEPTAKKEPVKQDGASLTAVAFRVPAGRKVTFKSIMLKPLGMKSIFNGKDLTGWKPLPDHASKFTVTEKGEINVKDGNGDLQSDWQGDDFVFQIDVISNGKNLNSGIFFRSLPGEFWQGYEAQIRNEWSGYSKDEKRNAEPEDRTKPVDIGTGGLYNRQATRKVVPSDHEWFTMTVVAKGAHIATWVNGYQCTDYTDTEADAPSARKGRFLGKGCITIQGHDPTTDLCFKNIRVVDLPKK